MIRLFYTKPTYIDLSQEIEQSEDVQMPTAKELAGTVIKTADNSIKRNYFNSDEAAQQQQLPQKITQSVSLDDMQFEREVNANDLRGLKFGGGRASVENRSDLNYTRNLPRFSEMRENEFDVFRLSEEFVRSIRPSQMLEILADVSPELSRALFDFILFCCPGWTIKAIDPKTGLENTDDTNYLNNEVFAQLKKTHKAVEVIFVKMFMSIFLRGAVCSEAIFDKRAKNLIDIGNIDPETLVHRRLEDAQRGLYWGIFQRQGGQEISLNVPQVSYVPIHPGFNSNKGRALARPSLFVCFFLIATLQDLRRVIRQQGYPRIDISINVAAIKNILPKAKQGDLKAIKELAQDTINEVIAIYKSLQPDEAYVHSEVVTVNQPVGALNHNSLGVVGDLIKALERMATRALKTMPLNMASAEGVADANANRQWEIYVAGIKSMQHAAESNIESHCDLGLRANGRQSISQFRFSELRASEALRDAQVELLWTTIARMQYDNGSIDADEMARKSDSKLKKANTPEPRASATSNTKVPADNNSTEGDQYNKDNARGLASGSLGDMFLTNPSLPLILSGFRASLQDVKDAEELVKKYAKDGLAEAVSATEYTTE